MYEAGEERGSLSCKKVDKSTMNSLSRKYPLVILSPYKDFICKKSNKDSAKSNSKHQKNQKHKKTSPELFRLLSEEANLNWELLKRKKLERPPLPSAESSHLSESPLTQHTHHTEQRMEVVSSHVLNSPNRAKLRMSPAIDLPVCSLQQDAITSTKKDKNKTSLRTSSRSNRGFTTKYSNPSPPQKHNTNTANQSTSNRAFSEMKSQSSKDQLCELISNSKYTIQKQAKLHPGTSDPFQLPTYVAGKLTTKCKFTPRVESPTKLSNSYSVSHFSLDTSDEPVISEEHLDIPEVTTKQILKPTKPVKKKKVPTATLR